MNQHSIVDSEACSMSGSRATAVVCLLRNDLRVHDNEVLLQACRNKAATHIVPLFCFDPRHFATTHYFHLQRTAYHRFRFLVESVADLQRTLRARGSDLIVRVGEPEVVVPELIKQANYDVAAVYLQDEVASEEIRVERLLKKHCGVPVKTFWGATLYHVDDLPFPPANTPNTYTQFRTQIERVSSVRPTLAMPDVFKPVPDGVASDAMPQPGDFGIDVPDVPMDPRSAFPFTGGETAAMARLEDYTFGRELVATYKATRNGLVGPDYSSKLSPWLALGCISPRAIFEQTRRYERERGANDSTYWLLFELIWRDYFKFVMLRHGNALFHLDGLRHVQANWSRDARLFNAWAQGRTGVPFVDANMRELNATGFQSNRGRQNVASFLAKNLLLDWRMGAEYFERMLIDHDVASNYGNWTYVAGVGNDPRQDRKFNMIKQAYDYDPHGEFVKRWCPELRNVPANKLHTPWLMTPAEQQRSGCVIGETYPAPIVQDGAWNAHSQRQPNEHRTQGRISGGSTVSPSTTPAQRVAPARSLAEPVSPSRPFGIVQGNHLRPPPQAKPQADIRKFFPTTNGAPSRPPDK